MRRPLLAPLNPLYRAGWQWKDRAYGSGLLQPKRLRQPVVSVGSLSAGGAGKTPAVLALAGLLRRAGYAVDVLSRGYGRSSKAVVRVDAEGDAASFGDEPLELARAGCEVFVGADRFEAGLLAERTGKAQVHLLDDGFQHRKLGRTLDLAVVTLADVRDHLLPAGNLREPLRALERADVVILREEEAAELEATLARFTGAATWVLRRKLALPAGASSPAFAFAAVARPRDFFANLGVAGQRLTGELAFPDHHRYTLRDCARLCAAARAAGANGLVTTAKDAVKLTPEMLAVLGPVAVARLEVSLLDEQERVLPALQRAVGPVH